MGVSRAGEINWSCVLAGNCTTTIPAIILHRLLCANTHSREKGANLVFGSARPEASCYGPFWSIDSWLMPPLSLLWLIPPSLHRFMPSIRASILSILFSTNWRLQFVHYSSSRPICTSDSRIFPLPHQFPSPLACCHNLMGTHVSLAHPPPSYGCCLDVALPICPSSLCLLCCDAPACAWMWSCELLRPALVFCALQVCCCIAIDPECFTAMGECVPVLYCL